jgi:hypothetical protein
MADFTDGMAHPYGAPPALREALSASLKVKNEHKTVAHPASPHTSRRAHDDPETPDKLDRAARASSMYIWNVTRKWPGRAVKGMGARRPYLKKTPICGIILRPKSKGFESGING